MKVSPLDRKLLRDLCRLKWQVVAIALLIACGVSVAVMAHSSQEALRTAQTRFYAETRFADLFAEAKRAPLSRLEAIREIDGVAAVDGRLLESGLMDVAGLKRPAIARIISLPDREADALNRVVVVEGRLPDPHSTEEAIALKTFMDAARVSIGDRLTAVIQGRALSLRIVGAGLSPEFVFVPSPESFMPDDAHQAVLWAPRPALERAAGSHRAFNTVAVDLAAGASAPAVLQAVDAILAPYGGRKGYQRDDQVSHAFLRAEFEELSTVAAIVPPLFLLVAAAMVHLVMGRLVAAEREQIGLLKAFGYTDLEAASPYLRLAALIGVIGAAAGGVSGGLLGAAVMGRYAEFFRFPELAPAFHFGAFGIAVAASVGAALAGSAAAVRRAARLSPAVAMQPPRPSAYRQGGLDHFIPPKAVDQSTRMIIRNFERFPARALFSITGLAASLALLVGTQFVFGSFDYMLDHAYYRTQRWSHSVGFLEARSSRSALEILRLPGVYGVEPIRIVSATIWGNGRKERIRVTGLEAHALLSRPLDAAGEPLPLSGRGVVVSRALAERLDLGVGDSARIDISDGRRPSVILPISGLAEDFSGYAAYIERSTLNQIMGDGDLASGAQLLTASDLDEKFYASVEQRPLIIAASSRDDVSAGYRQAMIEGMRVNMTFYIGFAAAIAFGVAFNTSRIALSERARDLATLQVLGFARRECAYILLGELLALSLFALPAGLVGGVLLARGMVIAFERDGVRLPLIITAQSYGVSLAAFFGAILLAAALVGPRVWKLDLVAVLKTRE